MEEAIEVLGSFEKFSHSKSKIQDFRKAAKTVYGQEWDVELDSGQRMQFICIVCNKIMNHVKSMSDHSQSGIHLKNICPYNPVLARKYLNLRDMLESTKAKAIGLQMVEEFHVPGKLYYKCILCGNHGKMQVMYDHVVGREHMNKYMKMRGDCRGHFMSANEQEALCNHIINTEGTHIAEIKKIKGSKYFPYRWMLESSN
ncbi:uncharacterized protein LOC119591637 [Penaeus monodon]|uniref:uncharacterized protein LOC119591637 n=1 Tax=Penaeus monodon TaxID=6687 RepID=UPI0018A6FDE9|nr:uncharacterized protein LOC119591637 [Penaeus monodon]